MADTTEITDADRNGGNSPINPPGAANPGPGDAVGPASAPSWVLIVGVSGLFLAAFFFIGIVIAGIGGYPVPPGSKVFTHIVLAILLAIGSGFLGGWAKAEGKIPALGGLLRSTPASVETASPARSGAASGGNPIRFGIGGGGAVFVIAFLLVTWVDPREAETKYKLEITKPPRVNIPPAPAAKDWLVTVDYRVEPTPPGNFSLRLEFSVRPDFKDLVSPGMQIKNFETSQAIDQIPAPVGKHAWARLILCDAAEREVATSNISEVKEPQP